MKATLTAAVVVVWLVYLLLLAVGRVRRSRRERRQLVECLKGLAESRYLYLRTCPAETCLAVGGAAGTEDSWTCREVVGDLGCSNGTPRRIGARIAVRKEALSERDCFLIARTGSPGPPAGTGSPVGRFTTRFAGRRYSGFTHPPSLLVWI